MTMRVGQALLVMRKGSSAASTMSSVEIISSKGTLPRPLMHAQPEVKHAAMLKLCPYIQLNFYTQHDALKGVFS